MFVSRRSLMLVGVGVLPLALGGCPVPPTQLISDVGLVDKALDAVGKVLLAIPLLSASAKANLTKSLATMDAAAKGIATDNTPDPTKIQTFIAVVNVIVDLAATLPLPLPVSAALAAASVLLPIIEQAAGVAPAPVAAAASPIIGPSTAQIMTPDEARSTLRAWAAQ